MAIDLGRNRCENNRKRKVKKKNVNQMQKFSHPHKNKIKPFFFITFTAVAELNSILSFTKKTDFSLLHRWNTDNDFSFCPKSIFVHLFSRSLFFLYTHEIPQSLQIFIEQDFSFTKWKMWKNQMKRIDLMWFWFSMTFERSINDLEYFIEFFSCLDYDEINKTIIWKARATRAPADMAVELSILLALTHLWTEKMAEIGWQFRI